MKVCKKCGVEKPISNFSKSGNQVLADGSVVQRYKSTCRQCVNTGPRKRKDNIDPKQCIKCGISKPLSDFCFYKNKNGDMRYTGECKECKRVRSKKCSIFVITGGTCFKKSRTVRQSLKFLE